MSNGQWKMVCNSDWNGKEAQIVCRQLGFAKDAKSEPLHTELRSACIQIRSETNYRFDNNLITIVPIDSQPSIICDKLLW